ncbi:site-specific integrase [Mycobacterium sp. ACS1612]|uniref:site-specific integrase n=1 Tax=Mycobacterium sp. ACS1612 TaxID=1834117 RepID=UPI0009ED94C0|nr:site-specific integrase [Mycobacterium sp. ACS1612]
MRGAKLARVVEKTLRRIYAPPRITPAELADYKSQSQASPDRLVFPPVTGTPLRNRNWRRDVFDSAVEALAVEITPHNLRDTAASLAIQEGASVVAVARLLGHESAATTLNHDAGLFPTDLDDIASRLNAAAQRTIASQRAPSDAKQPPTKHRPNQVEPRRHMAANRPSRAKTQVPPAVSDFRT